MWDQTRAIIQQSEEAGLDDFARSQLEGGAKHHVRHPQFVGQGALEGLGGAALSRRIAFDGASIQLVGGQQPVDRRQAEGAWLERALLKELAHQHLDRELGILLTQLHNGLAGLGAQSFASALVFAGLAVQRVKTLVAQEVIPALQCGSRITFAAPGPFTGQGGGSGQREVLL